MGCGGIAPACIIRPESFSSPGGKAHHINEKLRLTNSLEAPHYADRVTHLGMISIIVPTANRVHFLTHALESFAAQDFPLDQFEIVIVDNGSTDATEAASKQFISSHADHHIRYVYEPEPGLLSGRHRGALEARGDIMVFVDDDIEADIRWLQAINDSFADPSVHLVGGRNLPRYGVEPPEWLEWFWDDHPNGRLCRNLSVLDFGEHVREIDPDFVWGLNFAIRKQALIALGGFHPDVIPKHLQHFQGDGETGLTRNAKKFGYKAIYHPHALVFHHLPQTRMSYEYFDERFFYQGVCDSYAYVRGRGSESKLMEASPSELVEMLKERAKSLLKLAGRLLGKTAHRSEKLALQRRFQRAYLRGYEFHQCSLRRNPSLIEWVLKKDYWDYRLPQIE